MIWQKTLWVWVMAFLTFSIFLIQKSKKTFRIESLTKDKHPMFLEHWNRQKIISSIGQRFSCLLDEWIGKICKNNFSPCFFLNPLSVLRRTWTGRINLKILLGYNINYLSIWPIMRHPWFPTRKASKLTFICFQLQLLNTMQCRG